MQLLKKPPEKGDELPLDFEEEREDDSTSRDRLLFYAVLGTATLSALIVFNILLSLIGFFRSPPMLVRDLSTGQAYRVRKTTDPFTDQELENYVSSTLHKLHTWTGLLPSSKFPGVLVKDPGITIRTEGGEGLVTTAAYEASFNLNEAIRSETLLKIATLTPDSIWKNDPKNPASGTTIMLTVRRFMKPRPIDDDRWIVTVFADIQEFSPSYPNGTIISKFNKDIYVSKAVEVPRLYEDNVVQSLAYFARERGLKIDKMQDTTILDNFNAVPR